MYHDLLDQHDSQPAESLWTPQGEIDGPPDTPYAGGKYKLAIGEFVINAYRHELYHLFVMYHNVPISL